jgi:hypothetical protein
MNRKVYQQPELQIVNINIETVMASTSNIDEVNSNVDMKLDGGSDGHGRSRMNSLWTEEDGEEEDQF